MALPVPIVGDHMGGFDLNAGVDDPGFRMLLDLLASGKVWVKLCAYRNLLGAPDWQAGRPFQQKMVEANPERVWWGSDLCQMLLDAVRQHFDDAGTVELVATVAAYNMVSRFIEALGIHSDDQRQSLDQKGR